MPPPDGEKLEWHDSPSHTIPGHSRGKGVSRPSTQRLNIDETRGQRTSRCNMEIDGEKLEQAVLALLYLNSFRTVTGNELGKAFPGRSWTPCMRRAISQTPPRRTSRCGYPRKERSSRKSCSRSFSPSNRVGRYCTQRLALHLGWFEQPDDRPAVRYNRAPASSALSLPRTDNTQVPRTSLTLNSHVRGPHIMGRIYGPTETVGANQIRSCALRSWSFAFDSVKSNET